MLKTPIDVFLKNTIEMDLYTNGHSWKGKVKIGSMFLPGSYISNSGSQYNGGFVLSNDTSAQLWTKNRMKFYKDNIVYDRRTQRKFSITGYTHHFHDSYPYNGEYWFTAVNLAYVGDISEEDTLKWQQQNGGE